MGNIVQPLWADCPALTRIFVAGYPVLGLVLTVVPDLYPMLFDNSYYSVVERWHIWSLFVGSLGRTVQGGMDFLFILFELYMIMMYFPHKERDLGSTTMLAWVLLYNGLICTVFLILAKGMSFVEGDVFLVQPVRGLWPLIMVCLTQRCLATPTGVTSFFGIAQIPNKWYPLALAGFFMLVGGMRVPWSIVAALIIGYGSLYVNFEKMLPSRVRASRVEQRLSCLARRPCLGMPWVMAANTAVYETETGDRRYATLSDFGRSGGQSLVQGRTVQPPARHGGNVGGGFTAFAGQGNRLGEGEDGARPLQEIVRPSAPSPEAFASTPSAVNSTAPAASTATAPVPDGI